MAGSFEIFKDEDDEAPFRLRLTAQDGTVVAISPQFRYLKAVLAGITAVREKAATGFIVDRTRTGSAPAT